MRGQSQATKTCNADDQKSGSNSLGVARVQLVDLLRDDLAWEYIAIVAYLANSQLINGAEHMSIAAELEKHSKQEFDHALIMANLN
jgi:bacterioferritin